MWLKRSKAQNNFENNLKTKHPQGNIEQNSET